MPCLGNTEDHCCYLAGVPCKYLEENTVEGRRWACGLRREYGNWDDAIASDRYQKDIEPHFGPKGVNCKDWPEANKAYCGECGVQF
jgi:hypothetical protein